MTTLILADRMSRMPPSAVREILKVAERPDILSFAGGLPAPELFPVQALHTFSYAATFLGALQLVEKMSSPSNASAAQTLNSALAGGVLSGLATIGSGWLFDRSTIEPRIVLPCSKATSDRTAP